MDDPAARSEHELTGAGTPGDRGVADARRDHALRDDDIVADARGGDPADDPDDDGPDARVRDNGDPDDGPTSIDALDLPMPVLSEAVALDVLEHGELSIVGQLYASTNNALLCLATRCHPDGSPDIVATCIYKPVMGERPLADFPSGTLARRELASFITSQVTGWGIVPPTVMRDGPFGEGMAQLWIRVDETVDPIAMVVAEDERLRPIAVFDAAVNNTDRKAGHLLPVPGGHVYGVDHGVTFSPAPKLRTVLWAWRGQPFTAGELAVVRRLRYELDRDLGARLAPLLAPIEISATARRLDRLLTAGVFPQPDPRRPALPWPPV
jgi:hypothetical protein